MALPVVSSNSPQAGWISWTGTNLIYDGVTFEVPPGSTDKKFTWWDYDTTSVIINGDFEDGFTGWVSNGGVDTGGSIVTDPLGGGSNVFSITNPTRKATGFFPVSEGEMWEVTFRAISPGGLLWGLTLDDGSQWLNGNSTLGSTGGVWVNQSRTYTIPSGVSSLRFRVAFVSAGTAYIDDVVVRRVSPAVYSGDILPDLAPEDLLLFLNRNGVGVLAPTTQVVDGSLIVAGSVIGDAIAANQIDAYHVKANAITTPKLAAGAVTANTVAAGAITAEKLSIGAVSDDAVKNGSFEDGVEGWTVVSSGSGAVADIVTGVSSSGAYALRLIRGTVSDLHVGQDAASMIPVTSVSGRSWYVACRAGAGSALASGFYLRASWYQADRATPASTPFTEVAANKPLSTAWTVFEGAVTPPSDARYMQIHVINALSGSTMYVDEVQAREVVVAAQIGDGQITTPKLSADAIDGMTVTGATVRTAASGQRIQLDTAGLRSFNSSDAVTASLAAASGGLVLSGTLRSGSGVQHAELVSTGLNFYDENGNAAGTIKGISNGISGGLLQLVTGTGYMTVGTMNLPSGGSVHVDIPTAAHITSLYVENIYDYATGVNYGNATDTGWVDLSSYLESGFTGNLYGRRRGGVNVELRGSIDGWFPNNGSPSANFAVLPSVWRPFATDAYGSGRSNDYPVTVIVRSTASGGGPGGLYELADRPSSSANIVFRISYLLG